MIKQGFTVPALFEYGGNLEKEWYVGFRHTCPQCNVRKPYQIRLGINYHKTVVARRQDGADVATLLYNSLKDGWNPHHIKIEDFLQPAQLNTAPEDGGKPAQAVVAVGQMPFCKAIDYAMDKKRPHLEYKTICCYDTTIKFAKEAAISLGIDSMPIEDTRRAHIKALLDQICVNRQLDYDRQKEGERYFGKKVTGNFYNKYKGYLQALFTELEEFEAVEFNPCDKIKDKKKIVTNVYRHATQIERQLIRATLQFKCPNLLIFMLFEYFTGMRPAEIFSLKILSIDTLNQNFNLDPEDGKTGIQRTVPIPNALMKYITKMKLERFPPTHYIFSEAFRPGVIFKRSDYAGRIWKEIVIDELGINVKLYSFKGLGGDDKRAAGVSLSAVSKGYGHTSERMTKTYLENETERERAAIRELTPDF